MTRSVHWRTGWHSTSASPALRASRLLVNWRFCAARWASGIPAEMSCPSSGIRILALMPSNSPSRTRTRPSRAFLSITKPAASTCSSVRGGDSSDSFAPNQSNAKAMTTAAIITPIAIRVTIILEPVAGPPGGFGPGVLRHRPRGRCGLNRNGYWAPPPPGCSRMPVEISPVSFSPACFKSKSRCGRIPEYGGDCSILEHSAFGLLSPGRRQKICQRLLLQFYTVCVHVVHVHLDADTRRGRHLERAV